MKFLIWFGCLFMAGLLMVLMQNLGGIMLGPLIKTLIAVGAFVGARALCKAYDKKHKK